MAKQAAQQRKTGARHLYAPRHKAKAVGARKAACATPTPRVAVLPEPEHKVVEVMELEFVDPDIMLDEAVVTSFDDEDF